jgi:hypothetical protein
LSTKKGQPVRLSLDLSPDTNTVLEHLAEDKGVSKADILRRAIALMEVAVEAKKNGRKFGAVDEEEKLVTEVIGL